MTVDEIIAWIRENINDEQDRRRILAFALELIRNK